jgi:exosortase
MPKRQAFALMLLLSSAAVVYVPVLSRLVRDWTHDENYSHGFLVVPLALYFVWERRAQLSSADRRPSVAGLFIAAAGLGLLVAGTLGAEFFVTRISLIAFTAGGVLFLLGPEHLRLLAFPLAFLLLMIPIPAILFNQIAFPLQLFASKFGTAAIQACAVPVLREGNVIVLANTTLEVAEACSGIRSLVSLLTLGIVYGYFTDSRNSIRVAIALATIPIAVFANGLRVAGTGILASSYGPQAAEGFFHTFSGWLIFVVSFVLLFAVASLLQWLAPERHDSSPPRSIGAVA